MNRFDCVTSLLLLLQTRSVVTARFLSDHFGVTERTIYRDIRTLENAGVPIGAEAGVGYFLEQGYRLPLCRLREGYRDFRLDRILSFSAQAEQFARRSRLTLQQYLNEQPGRDELQEVELFFSPEAARFVGEQRYITTDVDEAMKHFDVFGARFGPIDAAPPMTLLGVTRLAFPQLTFEIEATAAD